MWLKSWLRGTRRSRTPGIEAHKFLLVILYIKISHIAYYLFNAANVVLLNS
jgi:hypothetical protein